MGMNKPDDKNKWSVPSSFWAHRNLDVINKAPKDLFAETTSDRTFSDWNRLIASKKECSYYINGVQLSELREAKPFESIDEMQAFFKEHLYQDQPEEIQKQLIAMTMAFGYQAGLFHATSSAVMQMVGNKNVETKQNIALMQPDMQIHLISDKEGLKIIEQNRYRTYMIGKDKHVCDEKKPYYAQTQTLYRMTPENIEMLDLVVDCPSRTLAPVFDERPAQEQIMRFPILRELIAQIITALFGRANWANEEAPAPQVLHRPGSSQ